MTKKDLISLLQDDASADDACVLLEFVVDEEHNKYLPLTNITTLHISEGDDYLCLQSYEE